jgi:hypothetical protein
LYGCETWSLTLREELKLRVYENKVLRRIFRPKREEVDRGWRRLHNEELHNLYASPNIISVINSKMMRLVGHVACMRETINAYKILIEISETKRLLGRPRLRWKDNIRLNFK